MAGNENSGRKATNSETLETRLKRLAPRALTTLERAVPRTTVTRARQRPIPSDKVLGLCERLVKMGIELEKKAVPKKKIGGLFEDATE